MGKKSESKKIFQLTALNVNKIYPAEFHEHTWVSVSEIWEHYPRMDLLTLKFFQLKCFYVINDMSRFGMKDSLTISSLDWKFFAKTEQKR